MHVGLWNIVKVAEMFKYKSDAEASLSGSPDSDENTKQAETSLRTAVGWSRAGQGQ